jgi:hypothetical protein
MRRRRVFGIGLSRTGTTSLTDALRLLGFSAVHYPLSLEEIERHDAATDLLVAATFESLDCKFPGSKFIYTVRAREDWLESCRRHWARQANRWAIDWELRRQLYDTTRFDPDLFVRAYERHERRVLRYFAGRPRDLLVVDICGQHASWHKLCAFLGVRAPDAPFPHTNRSDQLDAILIRLLHVIGDAERVAQLARKVSPAYIEGLRNTDAFRAHDTEAPLSYDGNRKIERVLMRACGYFGSVEAAAAKLNVPGLEDAGARLRARRRAKRFNELLLTMRWLRSRLLGAR